MGLSQRSGRRLTYANALKIRRGSRRPTYENALDTIASKRRRHALSAYILLVNSLPCAIQLFHAVRIRCSISTSCGRWNTVVFHTMLPCLCMELHQGSSRKTLRESLSGALLFSLHLTIYSCFQVGVSIPASALPVSGQEASGRTSPGTVQVLVRSLRRANIKTASKSYIEARQWTFWGAWEEDSPFNRRLESLSVTTSASH